MRTKYFATVEIATVCPSKASSSLIRGAPRVTFSAHIRLMSMMTAIAIGGRPGFVRDFLRQS